jgi:hypothetical protein
VVGLRFGVWGVVLVDAMAELLSAPMAPRIHRDRK